MGGDAGLHGPAEALPQVEPVSDLQGIRGTAPGTHGVGAGPVSADDFHAWVTDQPLGQRPGLTRRKHIDHAMGFHAGQNSGVGLPATDREVVHAQHSRRAVLRIRQCHDPAQQGHPSRAEAQLGGQPGAGPPGQRKPHSLQGVVEPSGESCVRDGQPREPLGERPTRTVHRPTDETPDRQSDHEVLLSERKILQPAVIAVVHSVREVAAVRTLSPDSPASRHHLDRAEQGGHRLDVHLVDTVEYERVPERRIRLHDQYDHRPRPTAAETGADLTERHSWSPGNQAYAVSRDPAPHNRTPR